MLDRLYLVGLVLVTSLTIDNARAVEYTKALPCTAYETGSSDDPKELKTFGAVWESIKSRDATLAHAFTKTIKLRTLYDPAIEATKHLPDGHEDKVTAGTISNCLVERPDETLKTNLAFRRVSFSMKWTPKNTGLSGIKEHHGYKFEYRYDRAKNQRDLMGLRVCRNATGCADIDLNGVTTAKSKVVYGAPQNCKDFKEGFKSAWSALMDAEAWETWEKVADPSEPGGWVEKKYFQSSLFTAWNKLFESKSGPLVPKCTFATDADFDVSDHGFRAMKQRILLTRLWEDPNLVDGFDYPEIHLDAIQVDYQTRCRPGGAGCTEYQIEDFAVCRSEDICGTFGIGVNAAAIRAARGNLAGGRR